MTDAAIISAISSLTKLTEKMQADRKAEVAKAETDRKAQMAKLDAQIKAGDGRTREIRAVKTELKKIEDDAEVSAAISEDISRSAAAALGISTEQLQIRKETSVAQSDDKKATEQLIETIKGSSVDELSNEKRQLGLLGAQLEANGQVATDSAKYNKLDYEIKKKELTARLKAPDLSKSARKEIKQERKALDKKNQGLLGKISGGITGMFGNMKDKAKGVGKGVMAMVKGTLVAGLIIALLAFLNSKHFEDMKKWIVDKLIPGMKKFYEETLKPFVLAILAFFKNRTWDNFKNIFSIDGVGSIVAGLAAVVLLLAPGLLFTALKLGIGALKLAFGLIGKAFGLKGGVGKLLGKGMLKGLKGGIGLLKTGLGTLGKALGKMKLPKVPKVAAKVAQTAARMGGRVARATGGAARAVGGLSRAAPAVARAAPTAVKAGAKLGLKGALKIGAKAAKFIPGLGLAVTAAFGIFDGMTAGIREFKKSGDIGKAVKEGMAGAVSGLTFGLIKQETISKAFTWIGDKAVALTTGVKDIAVKAWDGMKNMIPSKESIEKVYTGMKDKAAALTTTVGDWAFSAWSVTKNLIPSKESISAAYTNMKDKAVAMTTSVTDAADKAWTSVKGLIPTEEVLKEKFTALKDDLEPLKNLTLPTEISFSAIKTAMGTNATAINDAFANITGIDVSATVGKIGDKVSEAAKSLTTSFENITGMTVPSFDDIKTSMTNLGTNLKTKFTDLTGIEIPSFADVKKNITDLGTNLKTKFTDLTGIEIPSFADVKTSMTDLGTNLIDKFTDLTGIEIPSFADVKTKIADLGKDLKDNFTGIMDTAKGFFTKTTGWFTGLFSSEPDTADAGPAQGGAKPEEEPQSMLGSIAGGITGLFKKKAKRPDLDESLPLPYDVMAFVKPIRYTPKQKKVAKEKNIKIAKYNAEQERLWFEEGKATNPLWEGPKERRTGGLLRAGETYRVGERGMESFTPSQSGHLMNAQRTAAMMNSALQRRMDGMGGGAGGQPIIAPTTIANTQSTNITHTTTSIVNPDLIISTVNKAA